MCNPENEEQGPKIPGHPIQGGQFFITFRKKRAFFFTVGKSKRVHPLRLLQQLASPPGGGGIMTAANKDIFDNFSKKNEMLATRIPPVVNKKLPADAAFRSRDTENRKTNFLLKK